MRRLKWRGPATPEAMSSTGISHRHFNVDAERGPPQEKWHWVTKNGIRLAKSPTLKEAQRMAAVFGGEVE